MVAKLLEPESQSRKILPALQSWLLKKRLLLLGMFAWMAVCFLAFAWAILPREGSPMTMPELVKKLELSPKLLSFPASGEVNWGIQMPIRKIYSIRGNLESVDAFARWHYREVELPEREGADDGDGGFENHRIFIHEAAALGSAASLGSMGDTSAGFLLQWSNRWYHIDFANNNDSEVCGFLITTDPVRKEVE